MCAHLLHACCSGTCRRTNESLTFPVNCGFMVYRRTAETFYWPAMRDNAALTAECPGQNESSEYTRDAYAGNVFPCVLYLFFLFFVVLPFCGRAWNIGCSSQRRRTSGKERRAEIAENRMKRLCPEAVVTTVTLLLM